MLLSFLQKICTKGFVREVIILLFTQCVRACPTDGSPIFLYNVDFF